MSRFYIQLTAYQVVKGFFEDRVTDSDRTFDSPAEFAQTFHHLLQAMKAGDVFQILAETDSTMYMIENAPGDLFSFCELWGDGFEEDEHSPRRRVTEKTAFNKIMTAAEPDRQTEAA